MLKAVRNFLLEVLIIDIFELFQLMVLVVIQDMRLLFITINPDDCSPVDFGGTRCGFLACFMLVQFALFSFQVPYISEYFL